MFPKAHAAAYVMMAWRVAYCKVFYPLAYYAAYFSIRASGFTYKLMCQGRDKLEYHLAEYKSRSDSLSKKEQDILGRYFGVYGHPKSELREIAIRNRMKESGVEKAKDQALKHLRDRCQSSFAWKLRRARRMVAQAEPTPSSSVPHSAWWEEK